MIDIKNSNEKVKELYVQLEPLVEKTVKQKTENLDNIIKSISVDIDKLSTKDLMNKITELSVETYYFSQDKDFSQMKESCATALYKEGMAKFYTTADGTQGEKNNQSIIANVDKQVVNIVYSTISNLMKTKLDEAHRVLNVLTNILISKNAEIKYLTPQKEENN